MRGEEVNHMLRFLKGWLAWVEAGAGEHDFYYKDCGLCVSAREYDLVHDTDLEAGLQGYFAGEKYPFNSGMRMNYAEEITSERCHLNPRRLAWVKAKIAELEKTT
jgi:hypothetical protein